MPEPIVNRKPKAYPATILFLLTGMAIILSFHYVENLSRDIFEETGEWKFIRWALSVAWVGAFIVFYTMFFKIDGRRRRRVFCGFCLLGILTAILFNTFWWGVLLALGVMLAVLLAGQNYIERGARGERT